MPAAATSSARGVHRYADGSESAFLTAARWGASAVLADLAAAGAAVNAIAYSNYLGRHASAAMWGGMYKSAENLRILHGCGCDLSFTTEEGVSAGSSFFRSRCVCGAASTLASPCRHRCAFFTNKVCVNVRIFLDKAVNELIYVRGRYNLSSIFV